MARKRKTTRRRRSAAPKRVMLAGTRRRKNPTRRRRNPARRSAMARTRRRTNPIRRRRNPSYDMKAALISGVGFAAGSYVSNAINNWMSDTFGGRVQSDKALGYIKIAGSLGIFALAQYIKQNPSMLGMQGRKYVDAIENFAVAGSAVALADGIDRVMGRTPAGTTPGTRRGMRGVIVSSPTLANQLTPRGMSGTHMLPMSGGMRGSLEVYGEPQASISSMQKSYYGGGVMSGSAYGSCI